MVFTNANVTLDSRARVSIVTILMNANKDLAISTPLLELERLVTSVIIMKIASITVVAINVNVKRDFMEKPATTLTNAQEGFQTAVIMLAKKSVLVKIFLFAGENTNIQFHTYLPTSLINIRKSFKLLLTRITSVSFKTSLSKNTLVPSPSRLR